MMSIMLNALLQTSRKLLLPALLVMSLSSTVALAETTEVFTLKSDAAGEIIDVILKMYGDKAAITVVENELVVSAEDKVINEIRQLIKDLDSDYKPLMITSSKAPDQT